MNSHINQGNMGFRMRQLRAIPLLLLSAAWSTGSWAYSASAGVVINFGGNGGGAPSSGLAAFGIPITTNVDPVWTSNGQTGTLSVMSNSTYFSDQSGFNGVNYYNSDFATAALCSTILPTYTSVQKYGCRGSSSFVRSAITDDGPVGRAGGTLSVTDTTLTGTLQLLSSTDEPTGAIANVTTAGGARLSTSAGDGTNGYNYRAADGGPFGNFWQGTTTQGTLEFALTGTFTSTSWQISGGTVRYLDPGLLCQQGGFGSAGSDPAAGILCTSSGASGGHQHNGAHLSWGWDVDGNGPTTAISEIEVRDSTGTTIITSLSGVLASLSIDAAGNITTNAGEFRRADDPTTSGCGHVLRWDGTKISCGALVAGKLNITGVAALVPVPAALWTFAGGLGILGSLRRRRGLR